MKISLIQQVLFTLAYLFITLPSCGQGAQNPIVHADVPDIAIIRVGDTYYMSSTTMHMSPGCQL